MDQDKLSRIYKKYGAGEREKSLNNKSNDEDYFNKKLQMFKKSSGNRINFIEENESNNFPKSYTSQRARENEVENEYKEDNEDEEIAVENAKKAFLQQEEQLSPQQLTTRKRQRHDSDDENDEDNLHCKEKDKTQHESIINQELNEIIQDEDGDIIIGDVHKEGGIVIDLNKKSKHPQQKGTVYRDSKGRKIEKSETEKEKKKQLEKQNYDNLQKWAKGLKQMEEKMQKEQERRKAKDQPLTRKDIDETTETEMKKKDRFGDPMKGLVSATTKIEEQVISTRGFYLPQCKFSAPVNRFEIPPGYRWDGVDRSTGFERRYLEEMNFRKAKEEEYYKIRTEEM